MVVEVGIVGAGVQQHSAGGNANWISASPVRSQSGGAVVTTWKIGDSWITFQRLDTGIGSGKLASQQEAHDRQFRPRRRPVEGETALQVQFHENEKTS